MKKILTPILLLLCLPWLSCNRDNTGTNSSAPQITSVSPANVNPGQENIEGRIFGKNLTGVVAVNMGPGVEVDPFSSISATELYIRLSVDRAAPTGDHSITVVTSAGAATASRVFTVGTNRLPVANFVIRPPRGIKSDTFTYDASGSYDDGGSIISYQWIFGDGRTGSGRTVKHKYASARTFDVQLTVTDNENATDSSSRSLEVSASKAPIARFTVSPTTGDTSTTFRFDGTASRDPDGRITGYKWEFGDGSAGGSTATHKFTRSAVFPVKLTVTDNSHMTGTATVAVRVGSGPTPPPNGEQCTQPAQNNGLIYGNVVSVSGQTAVVRFPAGSTCSTIFYKCGDMRRANPEGFYGIIRQMADLGDGTFSVYNDCPFRWPPAIGEQVFLIYKTCDENYCP